MFCQKCGAPLNNGEKFCMKCGMKVPAYGDVPAGVQIQREGWRQHATEEENTAVQGNRVSPNVYLGSDGKYRWVYELQLAKNPTVRQSIQKILTIILLVAVVPIMAIWVISSGFDFEVGDMLIFLAAWVGCIVFVNLIVFIAVPLYSAFMGGSYWTLFEMDDKKITQIQMNKTFKRTQALALIFFLTDDNMADRMTSIRMGTQNKYDSEFARAGKIKLKRKWNLIDMTGFFLNCPVYVQPEDYDFVLNYILSHVPNQVASKCRAGGI